VHQAANKLADVGAAAATAAAAADVPGGTEGVAVQHAAEGARDKGSGSDGSLDDEMDEMEAELVAAVSKGGARRTRWLRMTLMLRKRVRLSTSRCQC